ncbi:MAG: hypothetical protein GXZ19_13450 [Bacteroidales bacterium]|nr:hypothetical protein [Bacteroidales bacterium]
MRSNNPQEETMLAYEKLAIEVIEMEMEEILCVSMDNFEGGGDGKINFLLLTIYKK